MLVALFLSRLRTPHGRPLRWIVGVVIALVLSEGALRLLPYPGRSERRFRFDAYLGEALRTSWVWDLDSRPDGPWEIKEQKVPLRKSPNECRILFIGDSGTDGW